MKILIINLLIFFSTLSFSKEEKLLSLNFGSSISAHPLATGDKTIFENKLIKDGSFILNQPRITLTYKKRKSIDYSKFTLLYSRDCMNSPILGAAYSFGKHTSYQFYHGFIIGGYFMYEKPWLDKLDENSVKSWVHVGTNLGIVPIIGYEINYRIFKFKNLKMESNTFFSPFLVNTALTIGIEF